MKQKLIEGCFRCIDIFCVWDWGFPWSYLQKFVSFIVFDPFAELFITLAIGVNTLFMALDYHGIEKNPVMANTLKMGNKVHFYLQLISFSYVYPMLIYIQTGLLNHFCS